MFEYFNDVDSDSIADKSDDENLCKNIAHDNTQEILCQKFELQEMISPQPENDEESCFKDPYCTVPTSGDSQCYDRCSLGALADVFRNFVIYLYTREFLSIVMLSSNTDVKDDKKISRRDIKEKEKTRNILYGFYIIQGVGIGVRDFIMKRDEGIIEAEKHEH